MLFYRQVFLLYLFVSPLLLAAPSSSDASPTSSANTASRVSASTDSSSQSSSRATRTPIRQKITPHPTFRIPSHVATHISPPPQDAPRPSRQDRPPTPPGRQHRGLKPVAILFAVLGAIAGIAVLISITRFLYSYKRTPNQDRIAALLERHRLQREMEELRRNPPARRPSSFVEPPPPYLPRPPPYISYGRPTRGSEDSSDSHSSLSTSRSSSSIDQTQPLHPNG